MSHLAGPVGVISSRVGCRNWRSPCKRPPLSVIVRESAQMMIAGPALVEQAQLGTTEKELGHANIHTANGAIDDAVDSELEAFQGQRFSFLHFHQTLMSWHHV